MRWILKIALFISCFSMTARFCKLKTGSFTLERIRSNLSYQPEWETAPLSAADLVQMKNILNQPYSYLGKGAQSFVFASQDGQYVIKFFRHHHLNAPFWMEKLPFQWAQRHVAKKKAKLYKDFNSYKVAYDHLREETGLLFLHLNKTSYLHQQLDLVDKLGIHHHLPLDQYEFLVQKRATLVYSTLEQMLQQGEVEKARQALTNLVRLLARRSQKGISDKDPDLNTNFGFIGTQPIQIDIGRFKPSTPHLDKNEIIRITDNLHQWLMVRDPELDHHLKKQIELL